MRLIKAISLLSLGLLMMVEPAFAADEGGMTLGQMGAGFGMGIGVLGGALGQSRLIAAALESISRNPGASGQMNQPIILGLAFIESLVLFCLLVTAKLAGIF